MDWLTFFSNLASSIAWPATVIGIVFLLKDQLRELLKKLSRLKWKEAEVVFSETMVALTQEAKEIARPKGYKAAELQETADRLGRLAAISPKAAILEAFSVVENAAVKAAKLSSGEPVERKGIIGIIQPLIGKPLLAHHLKQIYDLSKLRNQVAHTETFEMSGFLVQEYIDICLSIADLLLIHVRESKRLEPSTDQP